MNASLEDAGRQISPASKGEHASRIFMTHVSIDKVRHLSGIDLDVSNDAEFKHIIFTGKNGSGKTSVLDAMAQHLDAIVKWNSDQDDAVSGIRLVFNDDVDVIRHRFEEGSFVLAYFKAQRNFSAQQPAVIEKISFKSRYGIYESPRDLFIKYMLDLKMTQALAASNGREGTADEITRWFARLQNMLREIYEDDSLSIDFDESTYRFTINAKGREPFDFNSASDGFSAILDIVAGLMLRMAPASGAALDLSVPGIALIDEAENHLHLSLQKRVIPYLASLFPNVQFVVSTHSPFVASSMGNAVVYDLENRTLAPDGLSGNTYGSIVEGFFNVDELSIELRNKYERYKQLATKSTWMPDDLVELAELETYLNEIPDYLALDIATEYKRTKLELRTKDVGL